MLRVILTILFIFGAALNAAAENGFMVWSGFEEENIWTNADWTNNFFGEPQITSDYVSEGRRSLQAAFNVLKAGTPGIIQTMDTGDMSGVDAISFDIYNSSMIPMKATLMLKTGENWLYHESVPISIKPGWNKGIVFDLKNSKFGRDGVFENTLKFPENVRRLGIMFYPEKTGDGYIFLDNISLKGPAISGLIPETQAASVPEETVMINDFENLKSSWSAAPDWSCSTKAEVTGKNKEHYLKADFELKSPGQNAVFALEESVDLTDASEIKVDVYYPQDFPANMTMAFATGDKWAWQEGPARRVKKGWNRDITFNLKKKYWKNEQSKWASTATPADIANVKRLSLVFFPPEMGNGYAYFDNIRIKTSNKAKLANLLANDTSAFAYYPWNSFEKGTSGWNAANQGAVLASPSFDVGGSGKRGMKLSFITSGNQTRPAFSYAGDIDFKTSDGLKFDIYNPNKTAIKMSFAVKATASSIWQETKQFALNPGWNRDVLIDFTKPGFKSEETGWANNGYIKYKDDIREVILTLDPGKAMEGSIEMTDIKTAKRNDFGPIGNYFGATLETNSGFTAEAIKYSKWEPGTFESGVTGWTPYTENGWAAAKIQETKSNVTEGKKGMLLTGKDIGNKVGVYYSAGAGTINISRYRYIKLDVYNNTKKGKFTVALKDAANNWTESREIVLNSGWNRDIKVRLDDNNWKTPASYYENVTQIGDKVNIKQVILIFTGGQESAYYIDNICFGEKASSFAAASGYTDNDITLMFMPADFLTVKAVLNAAYYMDKNISMAFDSADIYLRGFGNELNVFGGRQVSLFDDAFAVLDPAALSPNMMGASVSGAITASNTSYKAAVANLWTKENWKAGTTYIAGGRIKQYILGSNYIGGIYYTEKRGYDEGADPFSGEIEQSSHIAGGDAAAGLSIAGAGIALKGEYLKTIYDEPQPIYINGVNYVSETIADSTPKDLVYGTAEINAGDILVKGSYRQIDEQFHGSFLNADYKRGTKNEIVNATYILDSLPPLAALKNISEEWNKFMNYTQLMAEYDAMQSSVDTYERKTMVISLKNDQSLAFSNYEIYFKYNFEGKNVDPVNNQLVDGRAPSYKFNISTKLSLIKELTLGFSGRYETYSKIIQDKDTLLFGMKDDLAKMTGFLEASYKITPDIRLRANYKAMNDHSGTHMNFYTELSGTVFGSLNMALSYGAEPFTGYWKDDLNNDTLDMLALSVKGTF